MSLLLFYVCCMELMHDFVKGVCVLHFWEVHVSRGSDYLICDARTNWMVKHYKPNKPGSHKERKTTFQVKIGKE